MPNLPFHGNGTAFIYVVRCLQYCKVGITGNMEHRLYGLQQANPFAVHYHTHFAVEPAHLAGKVEAHAHATLRPVRHKGEWFRCTPDKAAAAVTASIQAVTTEWQALPEATFTQEEAEIVNLALGATAQGKAALHGRPQLVNVVNAK